MINREKVMKTLNDNHLNISDVVKFHEGADLKKIKINKFKYQDC